MAGRKEKPLWEVGRRARRPQGPSVQLSRKNQKRLVEAARQQALTGKQSAVPAAQSAPGRTSGWRFRFHLVPGLWALVTFTGLAGHYAHFKWWWVAAGVLSGIAWVMTQGKDTHTQVLTLLSALSAVLWALVIAHDGLTRPWPAVAAASWLVLSFLWWDHYRWRIPRDGKPEPGPDTSVQDTFAALAVKRRWSAGLGTGKPVPGGMVYPIRCNGIDTHIGEIVAQPKAIAAAYGTAVTRVYAEEHGAGDQDKGELFFLRKATLEDIVLWNGQGVDRTTGLGRIGRWPDSRIVWERILSLPQDGTKHALFAGADGSGKTGLLNLGIANSAVTGWIAPVILDPQEGQALPAWREAVPYAVGVEQCMTWLRALRAAMLDRSRYLADVVWVDPRTGKRRRGMGFFNPFTIIEGPGGQLVPLGLPVIEITIDEAALLLSEKGAKDLLLDLAKLGRKAGIRLRLATQVPSLAEMKAQELRSILNGGTGVCLRTGDKVSGNMMNITAAPWELPKVFGNGMQTFGLGYAATLESRPNTPFRSDFLADPYEVAETARIARLDDRFAARMAEIISAEDATVDQLRQAADEYGQLQLAIMRMLPDTRGEIILAFQGEHTMSEVNEALSQLETARRVVRSGDTYEVAP